MCLAATTLEKHFSFQMLKLHALYGRKLVTQSTTTISASNTQIVTKIETTTNPVLHWQKNHVLAKNPYILYHNTPSARRKLANFHIRNPLP